MSPPIGLYASSFESAGADGKRRTVKNRSGGDYISELLEDKNAVNGMGGAGDVSDNVGSSERANELRTKLKNRRRTPHYRNAGDLVSGDHQRTNDQRTNDLTNDRTGEPPQPIPTNSITPIFADDTDDNNFNPPPMSESVGVMRATERSSATTPQHFNPVSNELYDMSMGDTHPPPRTAVERGYAATSQPMSSSMPMYSHHPAHNPSHHRNSESNPMVDKLDYLIHMAESAQDHRTGHVAEELVLYSFVGVFVIFVVDSFARAGKYTR